MKPIETVERVAQGWNRAEGMGLGLPSNGNVSFARNRGEKGMAWVQCLRGRFIQATFLLLGLTFPVFSQGYEILSLNMGAQSVALGGSGSARPATPEGVFQNPGGLGRVTGTEGSAFYSQYLGLSLWGGSLVTGLGPSVTVGGFLYGLLYGDMTGDQAFAGDPGRLLQASDVVGGASAAFTLLPKDRGPFNLALGLTGKFVSQNLDARKSWGGLWDAGLVASWMNPAGAHDLSFAGGVKNMADGIHPQTLLFFGAHYRLHTGALSWSTELDGEYRFDGTFQFKGGTEVGLFQKVFLRGGYQLGAGVRDVSFGVGTAIGGPGLNLNLDYAYSPLQDLGVEHRIQVRLAFGEGTSGAHRPADTANPVQIPPVPPLVVVAAPAPVESTATLTPPTETPAP